jgi:hypothetical protein
MPDFEDVLAEQGHSDDTQTVYVRDQSATRVHGHLVRMSQSLAQHVEGQVVRLHQAVAQVVHAEAHVRLGLLQVADADEISLQQSGALAVRAQSLEAHTSPLGLVAANQARLANCQVGVVVGTHVETHDVRSVIVIGSTLDGQVKALLDQRSALLLGLGVGTALGLLSLLTKFVGRRPRR